VEWATSGRRDDAEALLAVDPGLGRVALDAALVLGDAERVGAALAGDPGAARRALGLHGWQPLLYVAHSAFPGGDRTDGLVACAQALLHAGADPDAAWEDDGYERMTALHGAAGLAHEPRCADPHRQEPVDEPAHEEPSYGELGWAAHAAYLRLLATSPLTESRPCGDGVAVITGVESHTENGVACSALDGDVDATIAEALRWLQGVPSQWLLADPVTPVDLRERLVGAGARPERTAVVMAPRSAA
jgi:hypothetical protein